MILICNVSSSALSSSSYNVFMKKENVLHHHNRCKCYHHVIVKKKRVICNLFRRCPALPSVETCTECFVFRSLQSRLLRTGTGFIGDHRCLRHHHHHHPIIIIVIVIVLVIIIFVVVIVIISSLLEAGTGSIDDQNRFCASNFL